MKNKGLTFILSLVFLLFGMGIVMPAELKAADEVPIESIEMINSKTGSKFYVNLDAGEEITLTAKVLPEGATNKKLKWMVSYQTVRGGLELFDQSEDTLVIKAKAKRRGSYKIKCESVADNSKFKAYGCTVNRLPGAAEDWHYNILGEHNPNTLRIRLESDQITLETKEEITNLRAVYDSFSDEVKKLGDVQDGLFVLQKAEAVIADLKLEKAKPHACKDLDSYKNVEDYRPAQQEELKKIIAEAKVKIEAAKTQEELDKVVDAAKTAMDKVKTDAQLKEEEKKAEVKPVQQPEEIKANLPKPKVTVKKTGKKAVKITWKKVKKAKGYQIYRATSKKGEYKLVKNVRKNKYSFIDKGIKKNKKYFYKLRAFKNVKGKKGYGKFSNPIPVRVK